MQLFFSSRFKRSYRKLDGKLQKAAWKKIELFRESPFHSGIRTHKLSVGELWAFSVDRKNRVVFRFLDNDDSVLLINIGDHSIYRKLA